MKYAIVLAMTAASSGFCQSADRLAGTWACQSMAAGAYTGRRCPLEPWLKILPDKSYEWGREKGRWEYRGGALTLSERSGAGRLDSNGKLIFEYDLRGQHYVLTLYQRQ